MSRLGIENTGRDFYMRKMKNKILYLLLLFIISSPAFAQRTKPDPKPVTLNISVENSLFSPALAGTEKSIVFIPELKNVKKTKMWFLTVRNGENGKKIWEIIKSKTPVPGKIIWNGMAGGPEPAPDGHYSYKFFVLTDKGSYVYEKNNAIIIDSTPPFVSLKCDQDVCFVNEDEGRFSRDLVVYLSAGDENGIDFSKSRLEVLNYNNKTVKEFFFNGKIPEFIVWDGIDEVYNMSLPAGNYKVNLIVADNAGNISRIDSEIAIAPMPKEPEPPKEVEVKQEDRGLVINLSSKVLFDISKSDLKPEAEKSLTEVSEILKVYSRNKVLIEGHTDSSGSREKNMRLSVERAQSVFDFLVGKGVDEIRMQVFGFGPDKPVASNGNEKGKEQNRRVEIVILKTEEEKENGEAEAAPGETGLTENPAKSSAEISEDAGNAALK